MTIIKDEHIDFILNDISNRGVVVSDLKENILDHVCCIIEKEMPADADFYDFYEEVITRFFNNDLKEIQKEADYLLSSKYIDVLTVALKISGVFSVVFLMLGMYYKLNHLQGTGILLLIGVVLFSLFFLPILIYLKLKDKDLKTNKLIVVVGFLLAFMASVSCLFKIMQWPWATLLREICTIVFLVLFVPLYYFSTFKLPEKRLTGLINTIIMLVIGLLLFGMTIQN
ncbi:MAG: hypothetical protein ACPGU9_02755 [Flavobacteriaceae bacterium]